MAQARLPGSRALLTLLALPWELLHDGQSFPLRDTCLDLVRSTPGEVAPEAVLPEPREPFSLVVNVGSGQPSAVKRPRRPIGSLEVLGAW